MGFNDMDIPESEGKFLKVKGGTVVQFHIISESPKRFLVHGFGKVRIACAGDACVPCNEGEQAKHRWMINVFDRGSNTVKIFEFGQQIASQIKNIAETLSENQQTVKDVDIRIKADGDGMDREYFVNYVPKKGELPKGLVEHELKV